jgi:hypothetical protein
MREVDNQHLWVYVEIYNWTNVKSYRGRILRTDYEAILEGCFHKPFLTVENTFWTNNDDFVLAGRGENQKFRYEGTFHFPARLIVTVAVLTDCTDLFLATEANPIAASRWEQAEYPSCVSDVPKAEVPVSSGRQRRKKAA